MAERVNTGGNKTIVNTKEDLARQRSRRDKVTDEFGAAYEQHLAEQKELREQERKRRRMILIVAVVLILILVIGRVIA